MSKKSQIVVIGASAGGVQALQQLVSDLPETLDAALFVVLHSSPSAPSALASILQRCTKLPVHEAEDGRPVTSGTITVAKPDYHLILDGDVVRLTRGPKENRTRPAIDALFRSAAHSHSERVTAVILTGALDDGTAGLWWVRDRHGTAIVQEPSDAAFPSMPTSALQYAGADYVVPVSGIGPLLAKLGSGTARSTAKPVSKELEVEIHIAREGRGLQAGVMDLGPITPYTCPECHGILVQLKEGGVPRFRCHTGHAYSINNLLAEVTEYVEDALWNAIRSIEESAMLLKHIANHVRTSKDDSATAELFEKKATDTLRRADLVRQAAIEHQTLSQDNLADVKLVHR
ncbi:MAG TPA: chemotaxis protein CheB [Polyangiaceae bacterium]|nr:chemotaxis protein CheB [Polyangiaceae bacterium]